MIREWKTLAPKAKWETWYIFLKYFGIGKEHALKKDPANAKIDPFDRRKDHLQNFIQINSEGYCHRKRISNGLRMMKCQSYNTVLCWFQNIVDVILSVKVSKVGTKVFNYLFLRMFAWSIKNMRLLVESVKWSCSPFIILITRRSTSCYC